MREETYYVITDGTDYVEKSFLNTSKFYLTPYITESVKITNYWDAVALLTIVKDEKLKGFYIERHTISIKKIAG